MASSAGRQGACLLRSPTVLWKCPPSLPETPLQTGNLVSEKDRHGSQRRQRLRGRPSRAATLAGARHLTRSRVGTRACLAPYAPSGALETNVRIGSLYSALTPGGAERVGLPGSGCLRLSIWKYQPTRMLSLCQEGFGWAIPPGPSNQIWRRHPAQELPFAERVRPIVLIDPLAIRLRRATGVAMGSIANSPIDGSIALAATHNTV